MLSPEVRPPGRPGSRVALVTQGYSTAGGVQTVARWLETGLRSSGFDVQVFDLAASRIDPGSRRLTAPRTWLRPTLLLDDPDDDSVTRVGANGVEFELLRYLPRAELTARLNQFDLIQVVAGGPALALATRRATPPVVLQVATTVKWERASQLGEIRGRTLSSWRRLMTRVTAAFEGRALTGASAVLVENRDMAQFTTALGQRKVVLAPPGVDTFRFSPPPEAWESSGYLLSVCRLEDPRKGLDRLIRSYGRLVALRPSIPDLVLAGRGDLPASQRDLITQLGLAERVVIKRGVPSNELPDLYRGASVYLQASHEEGLGISVLEAMASGVPVVATTTAGTRETVHDGVSGWLVEQGLDTERTIVERVLQVLDDCGRGMGEHARRRAVEMFSTDATLTRYMDTYRELLGQDSKAHS